MSLKFPKDIFIVAAKRTAFGTFGGTLKNISAVELGTVAAHGALKQLGPNSEQLIDSICIGNVAQTTTDCAYLARHVGLKAGISQEASALTVNRLCGSGFQSIVTASHEIALGVSNVVLAGGAENMSLSPFQTHDVRWGAALGSTPQLKDSLWETLSDKYANLPMAMTAENLAEKCGIDKVQSDEVALRSQENWQRAQDAGIFEAEIEPLNIKVKGKEISFAVDEHPRSTTLEKLGKLKPLFKKDGCVSAGNASGISDGAACLVISSEEAVKRNGFTPMARIVSYAVCGVDPKIMGIGPVPAMTEALKSAGLSFDDMDLIEVNEAFACQFAACQKELRFDMNKTNLNGGAIAIGHPTGASGSRIMAHLSYELQRTQKKYAIGAACIGGGQGIAVIIERA